MVSPVIMSFYYLEQKTMLAQVPRLKFRQGFSKFLLFLCQGAWEGADRRSHEHARHLQEHSSSSVSGDSHGERGSQT